MIIIRKPTAKSSHEVPWIYNRGKFGMYLLVLNGAGHLAVGDQVYLELYSPKLEKKITTTITQIENNPFNQNICVSVKNKEFLSAFKKALLSGIKS